MGISSDLRQAVLQAAIQGKLTKQLPEDGNAKDLLEQFKSEKAKLVKEGKLKKEKPLPEITEDEKPFVIPENWELVRLGDVVYECFQGINTAADKVVFVNKDGVPIIQTGDITSGVMNISNTKLMSLADYEKYEGKYQPRYNDIFYCNIGTIGKPYIYRQSYKMLFHWNLFIIKYNYKLILPEFLKSVLEWHTRSFKQNTDGTAMQFVSKKKLINAVISIPPLAEQKRIVAKVEELMAKIDDLEKTEKELEALKKAFPTNMKASLLQAAMQGKLTEQLPEDGNAKDLLEQIKAEKAKLVKEGKLKKEKPLPEITEDEKPFDIPENWEWVRIGDVTYNRGQKKPDKMFCYIDVGSIDNKKCCLGTENNILEPKDASSRARKIVKQDDVIYATIRPYLHNVSVINREFPFETIASTAFAVMACWNGLNNKYLYYSLLSPMFDEYVNDSSNTKGVAYPAIGERAFFNGTIPLPPLTEQKRIVEKLEKLLPLCDGLK